MPGKDGWEHSERVAYHQGLSYISEIIKWKNLRTCCQKIPGRPSIATDTYQSLEKLINGFATDNHIYKLKRHQLWFDSRCYRPAETSHDWGKIVYVYQLEEYKSQLGRDWLCLPIGRTQATILFSWLSTGLRWWYIPSRRRWLMYPGFPDLIVSDWDSVLNSKSWSPRYHFWACLRLPPMRLLQNDLDLRFNEKPRDCAPNDNVYLWRFSRVAARAGSLGRDGCTRIWRDVRHVQDVPVAPGRYYLPGTTCPLPQVVPAPEVG